LASGSHDVVKQDTERVAIAVETPAVLGFPRGFFARDGATDAINDQVRLRLARWLMLALESVLAADILRTAIAPGWDEIGKLAAIAALRTVLNVFLRREMEHARRGAP